MSVKVVGLGSVAMDVIVQVNALPQVDGFSIARSQVVLDGGSAANVMSQVAKFGVTSGHIAQIGDDDLGKRLLKGLKEFGIDTSRIVVKPEGVSLQTFIPVDPQGEKMIFVNLGNCFLDLSPDQLDPEYISGAKVFYTDLLPPKPAIEGARIAKESGAKVVFNLQMGLSMMEEMGIALDDIYALLKYVDVFAPCREAFFAMTKEDDPEKALMKFSSEYPIQTILTLGSKGVMTLVGGEKVQVPAFEVDVVDTTGAGDSFIGAFMVACFIQGLDIKRSLEVASGAAALKCTKLGARSMPTRDEVDEFLKKAEPLKP